jgi:hypothetical protein
VKIRVPFQHDSHATPNLRSSTLLAQIAQACGYAKVNKASLNILLSLKQSGLPESRRPQTI